MIPDTSPAAGCETADVAPFDEDRLAGGFDHGAVRVGETVLRTAGPWTPSMHALLKHLADKGFGGAPRPIELRPDGVEVVSYLDGDTVGATRPWPAWVHSDAALDDVARWLHDYHGAVADFRPPVGAVWREKGPAGATGAIIAHNDPAPYNAVWDGDGLVGFVDWDMAGPRAVESDIAWVAFSWVPLHSPDVVAAEGFTEFDRRRARLERFLTTYGARLDVGEVLEVCRERLDEHIRFIHHAADTGDATYRRMIRAGRPDDLQRALVGLDEV